MLSLFALIRAALLVLNGVVVLHDERFLRKVGWAV